MEPRWQHGMDITLFNKHCKLGGARNKLDIVPCLFSLTSKFNMINFGEELPLISLTKNV